MIRVLKQKPEGYFKDLPRHYTWFDLYNENGVYAYGGIDILNHAASFHTEILHWNHKIAKDMKKDWNKLKRFCKSQNVNLLIVSNKNSEDRRWPKFIKLFGFPEPHKILISKQEI